MSVSLSREVFDDVSSLAERFAAAQPYPHIVIDDFLPADLAERIHDEARATAANVDASNDLTQKRKRACTDWNAFGEETCRLISYFNSGAFLGEVEKITGLTGLFGDPWLEGGGIHQTSNGGFLKMHTDFNWNDKLRADRRINILYYLNRDWRPEQGGELALADLDGEGKVMVAPIFNRLVIFNTNDRTLHGHPDPLNFPPHYPRTSIAMYYYTANDQVRERWRNRSVTTRYVSMGRRDIDLSSGTLRARIGYLIRRFSRYG